MASPRARARAKELGIDLTAAAVRAGRLTEKDVLALAAPGRATAPSPTAPPAPPPRQRPPPPRSEPGITKLSSTRKIIAERMTLSATTIPQVTYTAALRRHRGPGPTPQSEGGPGGERTAVSLRRAGGAGRGAGPGRLPRGELAMGGRAGHPAAARGEHRGGRGPRRARAWSSRWSTTPTRWTSGRPPPNWTGWSTGARAGKLGPDDYAGGTFTITSLASLGVESFNPIIVPPQAAILGVGAIVADAGVPAGPGGETPPGGALAHHRPPHPRRRAVGPLLEQDPGSAGAAGTG